MLLALLLPAANTHSEENAAPDPDQPVPYSVVQRYWQEVLSLRQRNAELEEANVSLVLENQELRQNPVAAIPTEKLDEILAEIRKLNSDRWILASWRPLAADVMEQYGDAANDFHYVQRFKPVDEAFWNNVHELEFIENPPGWTQPPIPTPPPKPVLDTPKLIRVEDFSASEDTDDGGPGAPGKPDIDTIPPSTTPNNYTGTSIGFNRVGEWTEWKFFTLNSQVWTGTLFMSNPTHGGRVEITIDGNSIGTFPVPQTQGWAWFEPINFSANLLAGNHVIRVISIASGENGWTGDIAKIELNPTHPASQ